MITYWHNPACSKSRAGLAFLEERGADVTLRLYKKDVPSHEELRRVLAALGGSILQMIRTKDALFGDLGLAEDLPEDKLIAALVENPALLERPIALNGSRAVIGRPTDALAVLL